MHIILQYRTYIHAYIYVCILQTYTALQDLLATSSLYPYIRTYMHACIHKYMHIYIYIYCLYTQVSVHIYHDTIPRCDGRSNLLDGDKHGMVPRSQQATNSERNTTNVVHIGTKKGRNCAFVRANYCSEVFEPLRQPT